MLLTSVVPAASAEPVGDWSAARNLAGRAVAFKTTDGVKSFGVLGSADDSGMKVQTAGRKDFTHHDYGAGVLAFGKKGHGGGV